MISGYGTEIVQTIQVWKPYNHQEFIDYYIWTTSYQNLDWLFQIWTDFQISLKLQNLIKIKIVQTNIKVWPEIKRVQMIQIQYKVKSDEKWPKSVG